MGTYGKGKRRGRTILKVNHNAGDNLVVASEGSQTPFSQLARFDRVVILPLNVVARLEYLDSRISFLGFS